MNSTPPIEADPTPRALAVLHELSERLQVSHV